MCKLHIGTADDLNLIHDLVSLLLKALLQILRDSQHGCGTEGITGVHAEGIDILNEANGNHVALGITDYLQFQLFPAKDRLLHQHLTNQAGLQASGTYSLQLFYVIYQAAACTTHGISRSQYNGISQLIRNGKSFFHGICHLAASHLNPQLIHGLLELNAVFTTFDSIYLNADYLDLILVQHTCRRKLRAEIQTGLSAEIRQDGIGALLFDNLFQSFHIQRLNVCHIRNLRIRHNSRRIGIHQDNPVSQLSQCLAGLGSGIVELTCLSDNNRSRADNQNFFDVFSLTHGVPLCFNIFSYDSCAVIPPLRQAISIYYTTLSAHFLQKFYFSFTIFLSQFSSTNFMKIFFQTKSASDTVIRYRKRPLASYLSIVCRHL